MKRGFGASQSGGPRTAAGSAGSRADPFGRGDDAAAAAAAAAASDCIGKLPMGVRGLSAVTVSCEDIGSGGGGGSGGRESGGGGALWSLGDINACRVAGVETLSAGAKPPATATKFSPALTMMRSSSSSTCGGGEGVAVPVVANGSRDGGTSNSLISTP